MYVFTLDSLCLHRMYVSTHVELVCTDAAQRRRREKRAEGLEVNFFIALQPRWRRTLQDHSFPCPSRNWLCLLCLRPGFILRWCAVQRCKVIQQQAVNEDVATADLAE